MKKTILLTLMSASLLFGETVLTKNNTLQHPKQESILLNKQGEDYRKLFKKFSDSDLVKLFQSEGYMATKVLRKGVIRIKINGKNYILYNDKKGNLQLYYGISGAKLTYADVNQWNLEKKFTKAYLDNDMDIALESDLEATAGISQQHVLEFLDTFLTSVNAFRTFVLEHDKS